MPLGASGVMSTYINSIRDIDTYVSNTNPGNVGQENVELVTEAITDADHPAFGTDWSEWLEANAERIALDATAPVPAVMAL